MTTKERMSPMTAFFMGGSFVLVTGIIAVTVIVLSGVATVNGHAGRVIEIASNTLDDLPELVEAMPELVQEVLQDHRDPSYVKSLTVKADFVESRDGGWARPACVITNEGDRAVSLLALRVAAVGADSMPIGEWTEIAATPFALECEWRGPIMPGETRHVLFNRGARISDETLALVVPKVEISDLRVWNNPQ